ncbi:MAG TPA: pseudouridine synthase [Bdellovibrionota bacterium]|nr:pseudouridine synthase [Bdellovibrionota bacterium]
MKERVQKILAKAGLASRRKAEELIQEGLVTINGKIAQLGDKAEMGKDSIKVKGKLLQQLEPPVYLAFNKPKGVISMLSDPQGRSTLADFLSKVHARVFPIGRLDFNSEGLLLLTNDGKFAQDLQQRDTVPRVYQAKVKGHPEPDALDRLSRGMRLGHRHIKPHSVRLVNDFANKAVVELVFLDSGAIDVKTLLETKGFLVDRIVRTAIGHITLKGLLPGRFKYLKSTQTQALLDQPELGMRRLKQEAEEAKPVVRPRGPKPGGPKRPPVKPLSKPSVK